MCYSCVADVFPSEDRVFYVREWFQVLGILPPMGDDEGQLVGPYSQIFTHIFWGIVRG